MITHSAEKTRKIIRLLTQEQILLEEMCEMTAEQEEMLAKDDIEALNVSIEKRQEIIEKLNGLHQETDTLMQSGVSPWQEEKKGFASEVEKLRRRNREILQKVHKQNEKNVTNAKVLSEQYKTQSNKLNISRKTIGLYTQGAVYEGEHFDRRT